MILRYDFTLKTSVASGLRTTSSFLTNSKGNSYFTTSSEWITAIKTYHLLGLDLSILHNQIKNTFIETTSSFQRCCLVTEVWGLSILSIMGSLEIRTLALWDSHSKWRNSYFSLLFDILDKAIGQVHQKNIVNQYAFGTSMLDKWCNHETWPLSN